MLKLLNAESKTVISGAAIVAFLSLASRFVGLIRDRLLAGQFGAGNTLDVYYAAFKLPDLFFNLIEQFVHIFPETIGCIFFPSCQ